LQVHFLIDCSLYSVGEGLSRGTTSESGFTLLFATFQSFIGVMASYLAIQASASIAQAGQQGLIPDLVE
jgi:hypothetical protein